ncbi:hypothetical protein F4W09_15455 [Acinetobacter tandoii]|uniref:Uncharacterized protein n=1 Tax=Acinetobacter tandoii TaxID=202954 RepID=A0A5N4W4N8_9GAMM|nr:hypothetical protein [Acinetobacter tandoii]KAB1851984.1 hypothetical protein F4W09_15455 [Acinetobacter tandoii]
MATLQELYKFKGNPDLTHWKTVKIFSLVEASLLTVGIDPLEYSHLSDYQLKDELRTKRPINWQHAILLMRSLSEAICTHEIKSPFINLEKSDYSNTWDIVEEQAKIGIENASEIILTSTKIHRDELFKWLKKNDYFEHPVQTIVELDPVEKIGSSIANDKEVLLLPEPTYTTPALEVVQLVIREFWEEYDPDAGSPPPKQEFVKQWIADNHPQIESDALRKAIDQICRHPIAKSGGNKKITP